MSSENITPAFDGGLDVDEPELPWEDPPEPNRLPRYDVAVRDPQDTPLDEAALTVRGVNWYARAFIDSGMFPGVKSQAQAVVKILAGRELGLAPFEAMRSVHIVQGSAALSAGAVAAKVKQSGRYNFTPKVTTSTECVLEWYENGTLVGESRFSIEDAQRAGLTGKQTWKAYPSDMLFARALTQGARRFAPDCFGSGSVYTPEELGSGAADEADGTLAIGVEGGAG